MKKKMWTMLLLVCWAATRAQAQDRAMQLKQQLLDRNRSKVMVVAHRGFWRFQPENSLEAIEHAIKMGVDIVEVDLQMTKDSVLVLMHDKTLDRTTTGKGLVSEWTADSIGTLYLKSGCDIKTIHRVPTLEETMRAVKGKVLINLDKADRFFPQVLKVLEKTGTTSQVIMKGGKPAREVQTLYGRYLDKIIYMPVVKLQQKQVDSVIGEHIKLLSPTAIEMVWNSLTDIAVPLAMKQKVERYSLIWYNTLEAVLCAGHDDDKALENADDAYGFLIDRLGANIIQTDRADYLLDYLRKRHLHD